MRKLIRSPLTWMVAAELAVVSALVVLAWHVVASSSGHPSPTSPVAVQPNDSAADPSPELPQLPDLSPRSRQGPPPGLNVDANFWRDRLGRINADQAYLERLEWAIVHSAEEAVDTYLATVVLPAIQHAERSGGAPAHP